MTIKSKKFAAILTAALSLAAPLALSATPADAASAYGHSMQGGDHLNVAATPVSYHQNDGRFGINDRDHRPAPRFEMRTRMPHHGYRWHAGNWNWQRGHWVWIGGFWNIR